MLMCVQVSSGNHSFAARNVQLLICELITSAFRAVTHIGVSPLVVVMNQDNGERSNKRQRHHSCSGASIFY